MEQKKLSKDDLNDPVTKHMRPDIVRLSVGQSVGEALAALREQPPEGRIIYFYVTDDEGRLRGVVPTRRLLLNPAETPVAEVMVKDVIAISDAATVLDTCEFFVLHKLLAFPVVDSQRRVVGLVDVDLYTQEMSDLERREGNDDLFQLVGVHLTEAQQADPLLSFRRRFPWLLCNVAAGVAAAFLSGMFEAQLQRVVALALFIPVVLALAESVTIQSVSLALQALHGGGPTWAGLLGKLGRELLTGAFLGGACGLLVALVALAWLRQWLVAASVLGGVGGGVAAAALLGVAVPNLWRMLRLDPQVAAGPIALAATDMATLLLYFNLARWLLG
jgi:magnesium transporter